MTKKFTIGEIARLTGLQTSAIRYYESVGLVPPPERVNGRRRYDSDVLKRLGLIQLVRDAGFGIRELQVLFANEGAGEPDPENWQTLAAAKIQELDALIDRTQAARSWLAGALESGCSGADDCVQIAFDESESGLNITLTCVAMTSGKTAQRTEPLKLLKMEARHDADFER